MRYVAAVVLNDMPMHGQVCRCYYALVRRSRQCSAVLLLFDLYLTITTPENLNEKRPITNAHDQIASEEACAALSVLLR